MNFVASLFGLLPTHLPCSHSLQCMHAMLAVVVLFQVQFSIINISLGSSATFLRRGGIFSGTLTTFVASFLPNAPVKVLKLVNIWRRCGQQFDILFFYSRCIVQGVWYIFDPPIVTYAVEHKEPVLAPIP